MMRRYGMWKEWLSDLSESGLEAVLVGLGIAAAIYFVTVQ
jgi:hypothetical protein